MSLKLRNSIALILILLAAVCWTLGQRMLDNSKWDAVASTVPTEYWVSTTETIHPNSNPTTDSVGNWITGTILPAFAPVSSEPYEGFEEADSRSERLFGFILSFAAVAAAGIAILALSQKNPICGPDGISLLFSLLTTAVSGIVTTFVILVGIRELLGWVRAKFSLCLVHRIARRCAMPQISMLTFVGWITLSLAGFLYFFIANLQYHAGYTVFFFGYFVAAIFGFCCLWKYGSDLHHFKKQLDNYQYGKPITVGHGAFSQTEAQLLEVQARHEEAVRTAVTSERFKVELISNVSHDLRTPLTSILGYSELLQKETLSPEGQEQLFRLHQKAGYMNDLVESLFELTKVSSGVVESKKDEIDLVRLLEQTIGLFDDQLVSAGLTVRRSYGADSIPVITDGARMHQVFANLLGNAIKYALAGTRIYLDIKETENRYLVRMMNTASYEMDFKPDEIMQRFARGDKARSTKGSGLGLAIAQTYTESVGGSFRVSVDGDQFSAIVELPKAERNL